MRTMPERCKDVSAVRAFCDCIADEDNVDAAAQAFCQRVATSGGPYAAGDYLTELKRALMDLED